MNSRHPFFSVLALVICLPLAFPADVAAQATQPQHAGRITAVLPIVNVIRGPQQTPASTSEEVFWGDIINTGHLARARVSLDDGSVLSVGSDSNLTVTKHDAASQQTDLDLNYGRVRAKAVKLVKPNASFQIRTPTGVAGVVGTDFALDSQGDTTRIVVYEGKVNFCALVSEKKKQDDQQGAVPEAQPPVNGDQDQQKKRRRGVVGPCVIVGSGEASSVQFNSVPTPPVPATPMTLTDMANTTAPGGAVGAGGGISAGAAVGIGVGAAAAAAVAAVVVRAVSKTPTCPTATAAEAAHVAPEASCAARSKSAIGKVPGQRP
ncbi:MAG: FecR family protein [Candidatus Acidiferrales bacterium]